MYLKNKHAKQLQVIHKYQQQQTELFTTVSKIYKKIKKYISKMLRQA